MSAAHSFAKSLAIGKAGESLFLKHWPNKLTRLAGRKSDFYDEVTGNRLELKSDSYDMSKTENFFIELWSDFEKQKLGGPSQAAINKSDLYIYNFYTNRTMFVFEVAALAAYIDQIKDSYPPSFVRNQAWTTVGIKVPRADLAHLYNIITY